MSTALRCPYCRSLNVRLLPAAVIEVTGLRCSDCDQLFASATGSVRALIESRGRTAFGEQPHGGDADAA